MTDTWLCGLFSPEEAADLTAELVAIRSYPGEEGPVQRRLADGTRTPPGVPSDRE